MGNIMVNIMENIMGSVETLAFLVSLSPPLLLSPQVPRIHGQTLLWVDKSCDLQSFRSMQPVVQDIFAVVASAKSISTSNSKTSIATSKRRLRVISIISWMEVESKPRVKA